MRGNFDLHLFYCCINSSFIFVNWLFLFPSFCDVMNQYRRMRFLRQQKKEIINEHYFTTFGIDEKPALQSNQIHCNP